MKNNKIIKIIVVALCLLILPSVIFAADLGFENNDSWVDSMKITRLDGGQVSGIVITVINAFLALLGVLAVSLIIYAGFSYMFSSGDPEKMKKAQGVIVTSVIGLVIIISAYAISNYVFTALNQATGGDEASINQNTGAQLSPECAAIGGRVCAPIDNAGGQVGLDGNGDEKDITLQSCDEVRKKLFCDSKDLYCDESWSNLKDECEDEYSDIPGNLADTCFCSQGQCCGVK